MKHYKFVFFIGFLIVFLFSPVYVEASVSTDPNFKVAILGDTGATSNFQSVIDLIKNEGAQLVLHQGDFAYDNGISNWTGMINDIQNGIPTIPYLGSEGNHDSANWSQYASFFNNELSEAGITGVTANNKEYAVTYKGLKVVFAKRRGSSSFINSQLGSSNATWKICSWHENMNAMQTGTKNDDQGWNDYEACLQNGAIILTGHQHAYERTKTLTSMQNQIVDTTQHPLVNGVPQNGCSAQNVCRNDVAVGPGRTFVVVSGLGGHGRYAQNRCFPSSYPYGSGVGCNNIWAKIYNSTHNATWGALFITFNYQGDPNRAYAYFKNVNNQIVDEFYITAGGGTTPTNTPRPTSSPSSTPSSTPVTTNPPTATPVPDLSCGLLPVGTGSVELSANLSSGTYYIWSRMKGGLGVNSYWLQVDGNKCVHVVANNNINSWTWVGASQVLNLISFSSQNHSVRLIGEDVGLGIDKLIFTQDSSCTPVNKNDTCVPVTSTPVPTVDPIATLAPSATPGITPENTPTATPNPGPDVSEKGVSLIAIADTRVLDTAPTKNYGKDALLRVNGIPDGRYHEMSKSYLLFDLTPISGVSVKSLKLRLNLQGGIGGSRDVQYIRLVDDVGWGELLVNYDSAPVMGIVLATVGPTTAGTWVEVGLPVDILKGKTKLSLGIDACTNCGDGLSVNSRETSFKPQLIVNGGGAVNIPGVGNGGDKDDDEDDDD